MMNQVTLLGRVNKIESKTVASGLHITNMTFVTNEKIVVNGEKKDKPSWHSITCFSKLSEIAEKYVKSGDVVLIQGKIDYQKYLSKEGVEKHKTVIIATDLKLLPQGKSSEKSPEIKPTQGGFSEDFDDEIPF